MVASSSFKIHRTDDVQVIEDLIRRSFTPRTFPRYQRFENTLVGQVNGESVAMAGFALSSLHPHRKKAIVGVLPDFRRTGFGTLMHKELLTMSTAPTPILVNGFADQTDTRSFFEKLGYQLCDTCHCLEIDLRRLPDAISRFDVKSYFELEQAGFDLERIGRFLIERYIESHQWNPPCATENSIWTVLREEQAPDPHHSFAVVEGDRVLAASDAHTTSEIPGFTFAVGWTYADGPPELTKAVLSRQLNKAAQSGHTTSYLEIDHAHPVDELLKWLPIAKHEIFNHFEFKGIFRTGAP